MNLQKLIIIGLKFIALLSVVSLQGQDYLQYIDKPYNVTRAGNDDIEFDNNYVFLFDGLQIDAYNTEPPYLQINETCSKLSIDIKNVELVKGTDYKFHLILSSSNMSLIESVDIDLLYQEIKSKKKDVFRVKVYNDVISEKIFNSYSTSLGTNYYYRIQICTLSKFLNSYEIQDLKEMLKVNSIIYEFDNKTRMHKYLLPEIYPSKNIAQNRIKTILKTTNNKIKPGVVKYGNAEVRF